MSRMPGNMRVAIHISVFMLAMPLQQILSAPRLDIRGEPTVNEWSRYSEVSIVFEKSRFRAGEEMPLNMRIENKGYQVLRIYPSPDEKHTFQLMVVDKQGREVTARPDVASIQRREVGEKEIITLTGDNVKEIILHPGEVFERKLYLSDYFPLTEGDYRVVGYFYPDARYNFFTRSRNTYRIHIDPRKGESYRKWNTPDPRPGQEEEITPEETVYLFLSAEMRKNWKNYSTESSSV